MTYRRLGEFEFNLPIARTQPMEVGEAHRMSAGYLAWSGDAPEPTGAEAIAAKGLTGRAVLDRDLASGTDYPSGRAAAS